MAGRSRTAPGVGKSRDQNNLGFLVLSIQIRSGTGVLSFRESYDAIPDFMQAIKYGRSGRMGVFEFAESTCLFKYSFQTIDFVFCYRQAGIAWWAHLKPQQVESGFYAGGTMFQHFPVGFDNALMDLAGLP